MNRNPSRGELRKFGWVMLAGFGVLGCLCWYKGLPREGVWPAAWGWRETGWHTTALVLWAVGAAMLMTSYASFAAGRAVYVGWMTIGMYLGMVMTTLLLTVMFVLFLPIFSLIRFSDPLRFKLRATGTYWEEHKPHPPTLERTCRPF